MREGVWGLALSQFAALTEPRRIAHQEVLWALWFRGILEKAMAPHSSNPCLENPMDGGSWWAAVHGVAGSQTRLSNFTFTFHFHSLEMEMATHSSVLAWRIPGTGAPGGLPSIGSHRVGHDWSDLAAAAGRFHSVGLDQWTQCLDVQPLSSLWGWEFQLSNHTTCSSGNQPLSWSYQRIHQESLQWHKLKYGWKGFVLNNRRHSYHFYPSGYSKGFRRSVSGNVDKDLIHSS